MPLKLISTGGGSVILEANNTGSNYTVNVPAVNGTAVTTGDSGTVTYPMLSSTMKSLNAGTPNFGMVLTGSVNCLQANAHNYLDIANCFTSAYRNYYITYDIINGSTASGGGIFALAIETSGSSLGGSPSTEFASGAFTSGSRHKVRFGQLAGTSDGVHNGSYDYPEIHGSFGTGDTYTRATGAMYLNDVYANSIKFGTGQGVFTVTSNTDWYIEDYAFRFSNAFQGRGLRMWCGVNGTGSGSTVATSYGTINVYGLLQS